MKEKNGIEIVGLDEIRKALAELSKGIEDRAFQEVFKDAAKIAKKALQANAPAKRLKKGKVISIGKIRSSKNRSAIGVGYNSRGYLARFFEKGGYNRKTTRGYKRGNFNRRPFIKRTYEGVLPQVQQFIANNTLRLMKRNLDKYSKRLDKKLGRV